MDLLSISRMMDEWVRIIGSMILDKVKGEKCNVDLVHPMKAYKGAEV